MHEYTFKVLKGSEISSTTSSDISIRYDGNKVFSLHVPDSTYEIRFMSWESEGSIDDTHILGDGTFTASYDDGKTAKAVMYGDGGTRAQATDFVFYFDRKEYIVDGRNILAVYNVKNTSDVEEIFPEWHAPGHDLDYLPKRIVIDESFKDFTEYRDQGKNRVTFDSID